MQKALSLYIDSGMFTRNTQNLHNVHHVQWSDMQELVKNASLPLAYTISKGSVTFQLAKGRLRPSITKQITASSFFQGEEYDFLQLQYDSHFSTKLKVLKDIFVKKNL